MAKKRKTKKDKIIADLKRELAKRESAPPKLTTTAPANIQIKDTRKIPERPPKPPRPKLTPTTNIHSQNNPYVKKDLTKSLALTILVIGLELMVYWQLR